MSCGLFTAFLDKHVRITFGDGDIFCFDDVDTSVFFYANDAMLLPCCCQLKINVAKTMEVASEGRNRVNNCTFMHKW